MAEAIRVLAIDVKPEIQKLVKAGLVNCSIYEVLNSEMFESQYESWNPTNFDLIVCGPGWDGLGAGEIAQTLKMQFGETPILFVTDDSHVQVRSALQKNGFLDLFYIPMDTEIFLLCLADLEAVITGMPKTKLIGVSMLDISPGEKLDFDVSVFFPMNNKFIKLTKKGGQMTEQQVGHLKANSVSKLYIPEDQMENYNKYLAEQLKKTNGSPTEEKKLQNTIRNLFHDLLSPELANIQDGNNFSNTAKSVVAALLPKSPASNLNEQLLRLIDEHHTGVYITSQKVAAISGLLALAMGLSPEEVILSALLCDIGLVGLPLDLHEKDYLTLSPAEKEIISSHVARTLKILGEKKVALAPNVRNAIQQHHERFDGKGFPANLPGLKISTEAQILSFALQFEKYSAIRPGQKRVTSLEAVEKIGSTGSINPDIIYRIKLLLEQK